MNLTIPQLMSTEQPPTTCTTLCDCNALEPNLVYCDCYKNSGSPCPKDFIGGRDGELCYYTKGRCQECFGAHFADCPDICRNRLYLKDSERFKEATPFLCLSACPRHFEMTEHSNGAYYCKREPAISLLVMLCMLGFLVVVMVVVGVLGTKWKREADYYKAILERARNRDEEEDIPATPSNIKPNLSQLKIVKTSEIFRGELIGTGNFGVTHKGIWIPDGKDVKIPVAIKSVGPNKDCKRSQDLLEEAYVMASVQGCSHLLPLFAICMTADMMLLMPYLPLGNLKDFLKDNHHKIGSRLLLSYCTQFAKGMAYMEERHLLHRNLAARNIFLFTPMTIKVAGFGRGRKINAFDDAELEEKATKIPFRWMALESLLDGQFDVRTDVWAFGSTVWEIIMYGVTPFASTGVTELADVLRSGERLPRPVHCSPYFYGIIHKCWKEDPEARPKFEEMVPKFNEMSESPRDYLAIEEESYIPPPAYSELFGEVRRIVTTPNESKRKSINLSTVTNVSPAPEFPRSTDQEEAEGGNVTYAALDFPGQSSNKASERRNSQFQEDTESLTYADLDLSVLRTKESVDTREPVLTKEDDNLRTAQGTKPHQETMETKL